MRILVAPDKFKGSLIARDVAESIAAGLREVLPDAAIEMVPMADGGEGTASVIVEACGGEWLTCNAHDALGRAITARYVRLHERATAVMEMSEVAGMWRFAPSDRDPMCAHTFGVGGILLAATARGATEVIVGLGGSATNDGGFGLARALGFRFLNRECVELTGPVSDLLDLEHISPPRDLVLPRVTAAADVRNPLLGASGATQIFGPQKGATPDQIPILEKALAHLADVVARDLGCDFRGANGAGAAGGLGFGLLSFCGAELRPGFEVVADATGLESKMKAVDVVITGEGSLDRQTLEGKTPAGVARLARRLGKRVFAIAGHASEDQEVRDLFEGVYQLVNSTTSTAQAMEQTANLLRERARELARSLSQRQSPVS
ncbi:MAG: glycerate 2-kinase [Verrucomicrobiota bacterium]|jgi:glycerate kinase